MAKIEIEAFYPFEPELVWDALTDRSIATAEGKAGR